MPSVEGLHRNMEAPISKNVSSVPIQHSSSPSLALTQHTIAHSIQNPLNSSQTAVQNSKNKNKRKNFNPRCSSFPDSSLPAQHNNVMMHDNHNHSHDHSENNSCNNNPSVMPSNVQDPEAKFREFAFKTMQDLLKIYGLSISPNDIVDAFKQQQSNVGSQQLQNNNSSDGKMGTQQMEPPTPPRTPNGMFSVISDKRFKSHSPHHPQDEFDDETFYDGQNTSGTDDNDDEDHHHQSSRGDHDINNFRNLRFQKSPLQSSSATDEVLDLHNSHCNQDESYASDSGTNNLNGNETMEDDGSCDTADHLSSKNSESVTNKSEFDLGSSPNLPLASLPSALYDEISRNFPKKLKKYSSHLECNNIKCQYENLREHYHCHDDYCYDRVIMKKEEIIRHIKWHKKRKESLKHGFLRFSSSDDCSVQFKLCQHNRRQTHYHCIQPNCFKVYISTSDVQMHSNYHRKDSAIMQEGFQRFRASEECKTNHCLFVGQKTTHFHCIRENCNYTFKNKADMEKHKTYHIKNEQLTRDGFKKVLRTEACPFENCRFSNASNHIHCIRDNCQYVLHSSGQLLSHKRKHERNDSEDVYRRFKLAQQKSIDMLSPQQSLRISETSLNDGDFDLPTQIDQPRKKQRKLSEADSVHFKSELCDSEIPEITMEDPIPNDSDSNAEVENEQQNNSIDDNSYYFKASNNLPATKSAMFFQQAMDFSERCRNESRNLEQQSITKNLSITTADGFFNRKRGRPPKNRCFQVLNAHQSPQAIFTSFKLEKSGNLNTESSDILSTPSATTSTDEHRSTNFVEPVVSYSPNNCSVEHCPFVKTQHFHCNLAKTCHFVSYKSHEMQIHIDRFHNNATYPVGEQFKLYTEDESCDHSLCTKRESTHYHCVRCLESFNFSIETKRHTSCTIRNNVLSKMSPSQLPTLSQFIQQQQQTQSYGHPLKILLDSEKSTPEEKLVVRAAGTYFPENNESEDSKSEIRNLSSKTQSESSGGSLEEDGKSKCNRPFCKLKKKVHFHCDFCNQAFTDKTKLEVHVLKHQTTHCVPNDTETMMPISPNVPQDLSKPSVAHNTPPMPTFPLDHPIPYPLYPLNVFYSPEQYASLGLLSKSILPQLPIPGSSTASASAASAMAAFFYPHLAGDVSSVESRLSLLTATKSKSDLKPNQGSTKSRPPNKVFKDEAIPTGYTKFRFNEDCNFQNCGYRNHQSHFHCCRADCFYSFCDKTRFMQHTARHERLDKLMGDDFKQYRANMHCGYQECVYNKNLGPNNKSSHFHCLKCEFICSDTNKVVAHRRQHSKMEYIRMAGFRKVANNEKCESPDTESPNGECCYSYKQTHYHCLVCDGSVLSRAQLGAHQHRTETNTNPS